MSEKQKLGQEPAFGFSAYTDPKEGQGQNLTHSKREGMSKRFYAACMLLPSFIGSQHEDSQIKHRVNNCYKYVDELLRQENQ